MIPFTSLVPGVKPKVFVSLLSVAGAMLGGTVAIDNVAANMQPAAKCDATEVSVTVPKPHVLKFREGTPPSLQEVNYTAAKDTSPNALAELNSIPLLGSLPKTFGGVYCLRIKGIVSKPKGASFSKPSVPVKLSGTRIKLSSAASKAGFSGSSLRIITAIGLAEGGTPSSTCYNYHGSCSPTYHSGVISIDRGPWQINSRAHPTISDTCARNYDCAAVAVYRISNKGCDFSPWVTYSSGSYRKYLAA